MCNKELIFIFKCGHKHISPSPEIRLCDKAKARSKPRRCGTVETVMVRKRHRVCGRCKRDQGQGPEDDEDRPRLQRAATLDSRRHRLTIRDDSEQRHPATAGGNSRALRSAANSPSVMDSGHDWHSAGSDPGPKEDDGYHPQDEDDHGWSHDKDRRPGKGGNKVKAALEKLKGMFSSSH